jgi:hypothetical protein
MKGFGEHEGNMTGIFREHDGNDIRGTFCDSRNKKGTFIRDSRNMREHEGNIMGIFREHDGNIKGGT